ncbi:hypothetical protein [Labrenzia sp. VG12]|uniref:hypothetical protein n=1 Tax=Labrenzia sp. VG12 TaxID=2021862 RepID=UPI0012FD946F|nr:hypothetical protein [Labrenzia sp. VG12]
MTISSMGLGPAAGQNAQTDRVERQNRIAKAGRQAAIVKIKKFFSFQNTPSTESGAIDLFAALFPKSWLQADDKLNHLVDYYPLHRYISEGWTTASRGQRWNSTL